jgi:D-alanyl-D-alanine carboxypeptidase/D-alanyl-D-alanine-endopeptidase (penicillin-binding protein 4)
LFSPASNSKLYTVALALQRLGPDYRIKTSLYAKLRPNRSGTLKSDLVVYGRGDPTINARLHGSEIFRALDSLVRALTNSGIKKIKGNLIGDESFFRGPEFGSGWAWDDLEYNYGAEISALTINDNTLQVSIKPGDRPGAQCRLAVSPETTYLSFSNRSQTIAAGGKRSIKFYRPLNENLVYVTGEMALDDAGYTEPVPFHNPPGLFVSLFKAALARQRIKVTGKPRTVNWLARQLEPLDCAHMVELGSTESPPLSEIAALVQKPSQNLYADLLLAHVGELARDASSGAEETSEELGIRELNQFLSEAGLSKGDVEFEEGSGLSRDNLATPNATVALLQFMSQQKCADAYLAALPVAGVDGTLRNRMKATSAAGNVRAKTGSLRWAKSLSGYVTTAAAERLAFCFMLNRFGNPNHSATADLDAMATLLAGFSGRSDN